MIKTFARGARPSFGALGSRCSGGKEEGKGFIDGKDKGRQNIDKDKEQIQSQDKDKDETKEKTRQDKLSCAYYKVGCSLGGGGGGRGGGLKRRRR
jgi:hypothetical protein